MSPFPNADTPELRRIRLYPESRAAGAPTSADELDDLFRLDAVEIQCGLICARHPFRKAWIDDRPSEIRCEDGFPSLRQAASPLARSVQSRSWRSKCSGRRAEGIASRGRQRVVVGKLQGAQQLATSRTSPRSRERDPQERTPLAPHGSISSANSAPRTSSARSLFTTRTDSSGRTPCSSSPNSALSRSVVPCPVRKSVRRCQQSAMAFALTETFWPVRQSKALRIAKSAARSGARAASQRPPGRAVPGRRGGMRRHRPCSGRAPQQDL